MASKELPKTKAAFAKFLDGLPPGKKIAPGGTFDCFLCEFARARFGGDCVPMFAMVDYRINRNTYVLPEWARKFTAAAIDARKSVKDPGGADFVISPTITVRAAKKILAAI